MTDTPPSVSLSDSGYPVLEGLVCAGFAGKKLAEIAGVSAPTLSKWRTGKSRMPGSQLVLLTLVLAYLLEEIEAMEVRIGDLSQRSPDVHSNTEMHLALQACLHAQEIRNLALAPAMVHAGARMFRSWFEETGGIALAGLANLSDYRIKRSSPVELAVP